MIADDGLDLPEVRREVAALFAQYEAALMRNDLAALAAFFWDSEHATRYGFADWQHGAAAIAAYRASVPAPDFTRTLHDTRIHTFGPDMAVVQTQFHRSDTDRRGLQSQVWVRLAAGWRIVAAHVSLVAA